MKKKNKQKTDQNVLIHCQIKQAANMNHTFSMRPAPRFDIAACFLIGSAGMNLSLPDFSKNSGTVIITWKREVKKRFKF